MPKPYTSDNADRERIASVYGPTLGRCVGNRLILSGYTCPHCGASNPQEVCGAPAPEPIPEPLRMEVTGLLRWPYLAVPRSVGVGPNMRYSLGVVLDKENFDRAFEAVRRVGQNRWGNREGVRGPVRKGGHPQVWTLRASSETQPVCVGPNNMPERADVFEHGQNVEVSFSLYSLEHKPQGEGYVVRVVMAEIARVKLLGGFIRSFE